MAARIRLLDIANEVGVSRVLVGKILLGGKRGSTCFSDATAKKVKLAATRLGYTPNHTARQLRGVRSRTIGVMMPVIENPIMFSRLNDFILNASNEGYCVIVRHIPDSEDEFINILRDLSSRQIEGFLFLDYIPSLFSNVRKYLSKINIPIIMHNGDNDDDSFATHFHIDLVDGVQQAVNHLIEQKYTKIALFITNKIERSMLQRLEGYKRGIISNGLEFDKNLVWSSEVHDNFPNDSSIWEEKAKTGANQLIEKMGVDAIIMPNDVWALNMIKYAKSRDISIPDELGIVGFDNIPASFLSSPELTSVNQRIPTLAKQLMKFFLDSGDLPIKNKQIVIKPKLIIRKSTMRDSCHC